LILLGIAVPDGRSLQTSAQPDPPHTFSDPAAATAAAVFERIANSGLPELGAGADASVTTVFIIWPLANSSINLWERRATRVASDDAAQNHGAYSGFADYVHANQDTIGEDCKTNGDRFFMETTPGRWLNNVPLQDLSMTAVIYGRRSKPQFPHNMFVRRPIALLLTGPSILALTAPETPVSQFATFVRAN